MFWCNPVHVHDHNSKVMMTITKYMSWIYDDYDGNIDAEDGTMITLIVIVIRVIILLVLVTTKVMMTIIMLMKMAMKMMLAIPLIRMVHCNENPIYVFLFSELCGLSPNFHIHVLVRDLCIYSQDRSTYFPAAEQADRSWKYINLNVGTRRQNIIFCFGNNSFISGNT